MKTTFSLLLAILVGGVLTGCEHWHEHHHDYEGGPAGYEQGGGYNYNRGYDYNYGVGPHYDQGWDHR